MFGRRFYLFKLFGFPVYVDLSWFVIAILITWSLAQGWFGNAQLYPDLQDQPGTRWLMGVAGALGLFLSIVLHELAHSKVAEWFGLPMRGITLFIFGGVAEMSDEPPSAKSEFFMAIAGPIASVLIGAACGLVWLLGQGVLPLAVTAVLGYLSFINFLLVAFNLIPAFPLDGGRVLRSVIWHFGGKLEPATRITAQLGSGFGLLLMGLAVLWLFMGNFLGAMWWFLIGMFLRGAAQASYQRLLVRQALEGEPVRRFMNDHPITVAPDLTIDRLVDDYIYRYHYKLWPVVQDGRLLGCLTLNQIKSLPRQQWSQSRVGDLVQTCNPANSIEANRDAMDALARMQQNQKSRLMVVEDGRLVGVVSLKDLMNFLSLKVELEERGGAD